MTLIDADAEHETVFVNFKADEQRKDAYLAINPKPRVPSLVASAAC